MNKNTIFVTGAANGIGEAVVEKFVNKGYFVGMYDINIEKLQQLQQKFGEKNVCHQKCDITNDEELAQAFDHFAQKTNKRLDVLCVNAGIIFQGSFENFSAQNYKQLINVNAYGSTLTIIKALKLLKNTKDSKILITSSSSAMFGIPNFAVYSATKAYLKSLTESLSTELDKYDIQVASVMPTFVETNMTDDIDKKYKPELKPEDIANKIYKASLKMKKRHYIIGKNMKTMHLLSKLLPTKRFQKMVDKMINS